MRLALETLIALAVFLVSLHAPAFAQPLEKSKGGTLGCVANHNRRLSGTEMNFTSFTFRNFDSAATLTITNITIYDANGVVRAAMPPFPAGFDNVLGPQETANFLTTDVFGFVDVPGNAIPMQLVVEWTADQKALDLYGIAGRQNRALDETQPQPLRQQRARATERCVKIN